MDSQPGRAIVVRFIGGESEVFAPSVEGIFPGVTDHNLGQYINHIRRHTVADAQVDDVLEQAVEANSALLAGVESATRSTLRSMDLTPVLLRAKRTTWQPPAGVAVQSRLGTIVTARCSLSQIEQQAEGSLPAACREIAKFLQHVGDVVGDLGMGDAKRLSAEIRANL